MTSLEQLPDLAENLRTPQKKVLENIAAIATANAGEVVALFTARKYGEIDPGSRAWRIGILLPNAVRIDPVSESVELRLGDELGNLGYHYFSKPHIQHAGQRRVVDGPLTLISAKRPSTLLGGPTGSGAFNVARLEVVKGFSPEELLDLAELEVTLLHDDIVNS